METFDTPQPVMAELSLEAGRARVIASDRATTVVTVRPADSSRKADIEAAEQTQVRFADGRLEVVAPKHRLFGMVWRSGFVDVQIELPTGSHLRGETSYGDLGADGQLGDVSFRTSAGDLRVSDVASLALQTSAGDLTVGRVEGPADLSSSSGSIRVRELGSRATLRTSAGDISIARAVGSIHARTAYGQVRVDEAVRGELTVATSYGNVDLGLPSGTAAHLDVGSDHGRVHNDLEWSDDRPPSEETVSVRARTKYGDITIRRS